MADNFDGLPIVRNNESRLRTTRISNIAIYAIFCLILCAAISQNVEKYFSRPIPLIVSIFAFGLSALFISYCYLERSPEVDKLVIDEAGIHVSRHGVVSDYLWPDVASVKKVPVKTAARAGPRFALKINRRGVVFIPDDGVDQIGDEFGFDQDNLKDIMERCIKRWGPDPQS